MVLGIFSQAFAGGDKNSIKFQLNKATESGVVDVPKDLFEDILKATDDEESRRTIMMHIFECLASSKAKQWRRVHAALLLTEEVVLHGSPVLTTEIASGHHFDLLQRLSFLEHFEFVDDRRAQTMVRSKAQSVRRRIAPKLNEQGFEDLPIQDKGDLASESTCTSNTQDLSCRSDGTHLSGVDEEECVTGLLKDVQGEWLTKRNNSVKVSGSSALWASGSTGSLFVDRDFLYLHLPTDTKEYHAYLRVEDGALCWSDGDQWRRPGQRDMPVQEEEWHGVLLPPKNAPGAGYPAAGKVVINGMVSVGHCSDTESESSAKETPAAGHHRGAHKLKTRRERDEMASRDCGEHGASNSSTEPSQEEATEQIQKEGKDVDSSSMKPAKAAQKVMQPSKQEDQEAGMQDAVNFLNFGFSMLERKFM